MAAATLLPGCGDPCRDLSDRICNCLPTRMEQTACRKRVHALADQDRALTEGERAACVGLLSTCTCEALAQGQYKACGLSQD